MEMTSDEIIEAMRAEESPDKARMDLTSILRDADLVKFAKAMPEAEQNESDYLKAYYFVEETKLVEESESLAGRSDVEPNVTTMHGILSITLLFLLAAAGCRPSGCPNARSSARGTGNTTRGVRSVDRPLRRGAEGCPGQFEATYNLGNALYKGRTLRPSRNRP